MWPCTPPTLSSHRATSCVHALARFRPAELLVVGGRRLFPVGFVRDAASVQGESAEDQDANSKQHYKEEGKYDEEIKSDDAVVVAVPVSQPSQVKSAWGKEDTGAKLLATANETIRRQCYQVHSSPAKERGRH